MHKTKRRIQKRARRLPRRQRLLKASKTSPTCDPHKKTGPRQQCSDAKQIARQSPRCAPTLIRSHRLTNRQIYTVTHFLSEALSVYDSRPALIVLVLRNPHFLERRQRGQNRSSDPHRVFALG